MEISINTEYLRKVRGNRPQRTDIEAIRIAKAAGFNVIDCTPVFAEDEDYEKKAHVLAEQIKGEGIRVEQSHAPFNRYDKLPIEDFKERFWRTLKTSQIVGSKYIVAHCDEPVPGAVDEIYTKKSADHIYDTFMPFVEYGEKHGIGIAIENTDTPPEFHIELIDRFNSDAVTACWDFGHANYFHGKDGFNQLKAIGNRLSCTHVHDNVYDDEHTPIFFGTVDWESTVKYLKDNYKGVFSLEFVYAVMPDELLLDFLKFARRSAEYLLEHA